VVTGYAVTFGGLLLLGGRAGDILGRRRMFVAWSVVSNHARAAGTGAAAGGPAYGHALASGVTAALTIGAAATLLALAVALVTIRVRREDLPASPLPT
jgi:MFS family permease